MNEKPKLYAHREKGGCYRLLGSSRGAGTMRGVDLVVYQHVGDGKIYHRKPGDFDKQMVELDDS